MIEHSRQALVGAFGGTYISLAIADIDELSISNFALLNTADFDHPMQAVERYLTSLPRCPSKVSLAIAGTIEGGAAHFFHRDWTLNRDDVRASTHAQHVNLVNDIEATALVLPSLSAYDLQQLKDGAPAPYANKAVLMAGAATGIAGLVHAGNEWVPVAGEGGHIRFMLSRAEGELLGELFSTAGYTSCEDVFTGKGLVALYGALTAKGKPSAYAMSARQIASAGLSGEDAVAGRALQIMATWLGRLAGDIALLYGARGGLYLGGGLIANIIPALETGHFREAFEDRGIRSDYMAAVPVRVIKISADAGLRGAAVAMARTLPTGAASRQAASRVS